MSLVWTAIDPARLGEPPSGVELVEFHAGGPEPEGIADVEFYVPDYEGIPGVRGLLARMRALRVVQTQTAGVEHIAPFLPDGVTLCNARGVHDASTSELAMTLMLAVLRGIPEFVQAQQSGRWLHRSRKALADHTVLIVGYGSIGAALERRLEGFECSVLRVARHVRPGVQAWDDLPALLPQADVVVMLTPLTDETRGLVDAQFLAAMRDGAVLVNVARGGVVDTEALLAEAGSGRLLAALDVTDPEPLPADHPLWRCPGVLVTPHVGGATTAMGPRVDRLVVDQLRRFVAGEQLVNCVAR
ncbi:MAG: 2-hydroxyacid dehydrogenase [Nocardioidaceae bacterium]